MNIKANNFKGSFTEAKFMGNIEDNMKYNIKDNIKDNIENKIKDNLRTI